VISLAPDAPAAKAGRGLAGGAKWASLGRSERAVWGECQGSGSTPYQTRIDLRGPAFKCSCPSRKFPCKHALGLFLLAVEKPGAVALGEAPAWVNDWLSGRDDREAKAAETAEQGGPGGASATREPDPVARAKREARRGGLVAGGLDRVERWLLDLVGEGLAAAQAKPRAFWEEIAAAMVDAQCPGVAGMLREAEAASASGEGWQVRLLDELARVWLLVRAARVQEQLPDGLRADVRSLLGYTVPKETVLAEGEIVGGRWVVAGQVTESEGALTAQRTWLWEERGNRSAVQLEFAAGGRAIGSTLAVGLAFDAELAFYPSAAPERAVIRSQSDAASASPGDGSGHPTWRDALARVTDIVGANPWRRRFPVAIGGVRPVRGEADRWWIVDREGEGVALSGRADGVWTILAGAGGRPVGMFGEWDGRGFLPLSAWQGGQFVDLSRREAAA
jgi:hypothetical protein